MMLRSSSNGTTNMIKVIKDPTESYFKKITLFEFEISGNKINISYVEDSNEAFIRYWDFIHNAWTDDTPQTVNDLGRDMDGLPYFESWVHEERSTNAIKEGEYNFEKWKKEYIEDAEAYN